MVQIIEKMTPRKERIEQAKWVNKRCSSSSAGDPVELFDKKSIASEENHCECGKEDGALPEVLNLKFPDLVEIFSKLS